MRILRLLLLAWPRDFRERHGEEVLAFWREQRRERRYTGPLGVLRFGAGVVLDALGRGSRERIRERRAKGEREGLMRTLGMDLHFARRAMAGAPLSTLAATLTLGLGVAATTLVFAAVNGVVLRPLPFPEAQQLVQVLRTDDPDQTQSVSWPDFADWRSQARGFAGMAGYAEREGTFGWSEGAEQLPGAYVTHDFFRVMGAEPVMGRAFAADEDVSGGPRVMVVSHTFWRSRIGGDTDPVGSTVVMDGEEWTIIGVTPEGFVYPFEPAWFWIPMGEDDLLASVGLPTGTRTLAFLEVVGRLAPDADPAAAQEDLRALARRIDDEVGKRPEQRSRVTLVPLAEHLLGEADRTLFFLLAAAALVLLVATANAAALAISRSATRSREMAVRTALGAGRGRLARQLYTEAALLSLGAGLLGTVGAWALLRPVRRLVPSDFPRAHAMSVDGFTLLFALAVTAATALLLGTLPAVLSSRGAPAAGLTASSRGASSSGRALLPQKLLATFQVAASVVLLTGAVLLVASFARLMGTDRGFDAESLVVATVAPPESRYQEPADVDAFYAQLLEELRARPEITRASSTYSPPLFGTYLNTTVVPEGEEDDPANRHWVGTVIVRDGYFETQGTPLLRGRDFNRSDVLGAQPVVIVNEALARRFWPGEDPMGKRIRFTGGLRGSADSFSSGFFPREWMTVVGLAADARRETLVRPAEAEYYRPHGQITWGSQYVMVRSTMEPERLATTIREAVWSLDAGVPVREVRTMESQVTASVAHRRFQMLLLVGFAVIASLLAMVGLYAVMALAVSRRVREMGIRLALGARPGDVARGVLAGGMRIAVLGAALGVAASYATASVLAGMLFEVDPTGISTYALVVSATVAVAALASWLPARRAARVDPARSLQEE